MKVWYTQIHYLATCPAFSSATCQPQRLPLGVWLFISMHFTSQDFFISFWPRNPNPNPNNNPDSIPISAVAATCLKIKRREINCLQMNCPFPLPIRCQTYNLKIVWSGWMERAIGVALVYIRAIAGSDKRYKLDVQVLEIFDNNISTGSKTGI